MAKPKIEKEDENLQKLVREYWQTLEMEEQEKIIKPRTKKIRVSEALRNA